MAQRRTLCGLHHVRYGFGQSILHLSHDDAYKRVSALSWLRYDEVAVPRIVKMFNRFEIEGTFFVPAWCIERYPATVQHIVDSGHELAHHGYLHEQPRTSHGKASAIGSNAAST